MNISSAFNSREFGEAGASSSSSPPSNAAVGGTNNKPLCRYFASNMCYRGDACPFSHDRNSKPDMVCKFYLADGCSYGSACRYDHVRPKTAQPLTASSEDVGSKNTPVTVLLNSQKSSSTRFATLPCMNQGVPSSAQGKSIKVNKESKEINDTAPVNAWSKPLQQSKNFFSMSEMGRELDQINADEEQTIYPPIPLEDVPLCPYHETGYCIDGPDCIFVHGNLCEMCGLNVLHPFNDESSKQHHRECLAEHEKAMEEAFAGARSLNKQCGICMELIVEKKLRFGILQNCKHCFCLDCIREWRRRSETFETKTVRSCPECRVLSDFIIPSENWVEEQDEKNKVIELYRENMKQKQCKYIKAGQVDDCPFGNKCFYKHILPDGTVVEGDSPRVLRRQRRFVLELHRDLLEDSDDEAIMTEVVSHLMLHSIGGGGSSSASSVVGRSPRTSTPRNSSERRRRFQL